MPTHVAIELVSIRSNYGLRGTEGGIDDQYTGNEARDGDTGISSVVESLTSDNFEWFRAWEKMGRK